MFGFVVLRSTQNVPREYREFTEETHRNHILILPYRNISNYTVHWWVYRHTHTSGSDEAQMRAERQIKQSNGMYRSTGTRRRLETKHFT